jgi:hypothetical protein
VARNLKKTKRKERSKREQARTKQTNKQQKSNKFSKSCFGILLQKTSGGEAVLDFLQKLQVKLAWDFFAKDFMI